MEPTKRIKILVVDDSAIVRDATKLALEECGYEVAVWGTPMGFSIVLHREKPDLVLLDVTMPALQGDKLVEIMRLNGQHSCPVVLFSERPEAELKLLAATCGAAGWLRKTADAGILSETIRNHLKL